MYGQNRNAFRLLAGKPQGNRPLEDIAIDGRIILK